MMIRPGLIAAIPALACALAALLAAPLIAPHDPYDLATLDLMNSLLPPDFMAGGDGSFPLGADDQGRDILSGIIWGIRASLGVGLAATSLAAALGIAAGLIAGSAGRITDAIIMRIADIQLTFPAMLIALLIDGVLRVVWPASAEARPAASILVLAIALSGWPLFARTVRSSTLVERQKDYVLAARLVGRRPGAILLLHILPNVRGPVLVVAAVTIANATISEATLSFLGVGLSPSTPSLGTMIRFGSAYLLSGEWWVIVFPGAALVLLIWSVNLLGDWLAERAEHAVS